MIACYLSIHMGQIPHSNKFWREVQAATYRYHDKTLVHNVKKEIDQRFTMLVLRPDTAQPGLSKFKILQQHFRSIMSLQRAIPFIQSVFQACPRPRINALMIISSPSWFKILIQFARQMGLCGWILRFRMFYRIFIDESLPSIVFVMIKLGIE